MITISVERGLVRLQSWEDIYETSGFEKSLDPKQMQLKEIIGVYAFETMQPCGLKNCRQPHANGYLVTTTKGQVTNIGNICGKRNFSVAFTDLKRTFDRDLVAKERRERLEILQSRLPALFTALEEVKNRALPYYAAIRHLTGDSGAMPRVIVEAVRNMRRSGDGAVNLYRKATKQEHELAIATGVARQGAPYYVQETVGRLSNLGALSASNSMRQLLQELEPALLHLKEADVASMKEKDARKIDKVTAGLDTRLEQLAESATSIESFVTKANLGQLRAILDSSPDRNQFEIFLNALPGT
jgi:hypothetical protein